MALTFQRPFVARLARNLQTAPALIQVVVGPRQVGKTTGVRQLMARAGNQLDQTLGPTAE